jgi:hypothetical protein
MSKTHTLPSTLPTEWIASFKMPSRNGCYESFKVLRNVGGYHPYVVHTASYKDEGDERGWFYHGGHYAKTLDEAEKNFKNAIV